MITDSDNVAHNLKEFCDNFTSSNIASTILVLSFDVVSTVCNVIYNKKSCIYLKWFCLVEQLELDSIEQCVKLKLKISETKLAWV